MDLNSMCMKSDMSYGSHMAPEHSNLSDDSDSEESSNTMHQGLGFKQGVGIQLETKRKHNSTMDDDEEKNSKKRKFDEKDIVGRMMRNMGYQKGEGLGKYKQGRLQPVEPAKQLGRRGLGLYIPGLEDASLKFDPTEEEVKLVEDISWLENKHSNTLEIDQLREWLVLGPARFSIDNETTFCNPEIVKNIITSKSVFDELDKVEMRRARTRSNPFETIRGSIFLNRAAVKMANMDKACGFMFTNPPNLRNDELLYFADVCAGPGGFSEYVLWRKKWHAKGFGFTLKGENDFQLDNFYAGPCETFHPYYGPREDGDVFQPSNQEAFKNLIMQYTDNVGVHFMMADGGFSVEGQENIQEILSKQLYLCQCLVALMIVRPGGHFVTKLFDLFTPFSAGLVYLMYRCFDEISIFKPNTSRPANSERYLICKGKREDVEDIVNYLKSVNELLLTRTKDQDVMELVSLHELENESEFIKYLRESNNIIGAKQITGLLKIAAFCEDTSLVETRQANIRRECLNHWELPEVTRKAPHNDGRLNEKFLRLVNSNQNILSHRPKKLTEQNIHTTILSMPYDWSYTLSSASDHCSQDDISAHKTTLYMGLGRNKVYYYSGNNWEKVDKHKIELPPDTVVYAELSDEYTKESRYQYRTQALHILDACVLGGEDISQNDLDNRHRLIRKFCKALWKPSTGEYIRVRAQEFYPLDSHVDEKFQIKPRTMKRNNQALTYTIPRTSMEYNNNQELEKLYSVVNQIIFLKNTVMPWTRHYSKTNNMTYVFDTKKNKSFFENDRPAEAEAKFVDTFLNRIVWDWPHDQKLTMKTVITLMQQKCPEMN